MQRKTFFFFLCLAISHLAIAQSSTILKGTITDAVTGETVIGASVTIYKGKILKTGEQTDIDGNFEINVDPGKYDVCVTYIGYSPILMTDVEILEKKTNLLDVKLHIGENLGQVVVLPFIKPRIEAIGSSNMSLTSSEIQKMPVRDIDAMAGLTMAQPYDLKKKRKLKIRRNQYQNTEFLRDGIRFPELQLPTALQIEMMIPVLTGISANFEDFSDAQF
ncbi:MAG: hypothetical protein RLZZ292_230 [Bacteroidota bacterium]|jgi:hypothetical protein